MGDRAWWQTTSIYHIYPLGLCGAPAANDFAAKAEHRLTMITDLLPEIAEMEFGGIYLGPVFESTSHGYDTADYGRVDRRLGSNYDLRELVEKAHGLGIKVVLDGVFNHVGRDFWAFRDVRQNGRDSAYVDWFRGIDFSCNNRFDDGFCYEGWEGTDRLVALNLDSGHVRDHLFGAVRDWISTFAIDGLRLDVAYLLPDAFLDSLRRVVDGACPGFWLMGEVIHGDYAHFTAAGRLHSVTNYECYKGLWSSHNDGNYFEIAHSLDRLFGEGGVARDVSLYNFADNHDVDRVATSLANKAHLYPLYTILFTMPGIPSIYYGSEWGIEGAKRDGDRVLRPAWPEIQHGNPALHDHVLKLIKIRCKETVLQNGGYEQIAVTNEQLAFRRASGSGEVLVAVNLSDEPGRLSLSGTLPENGRCLFSGAKVSLRTDDGKPAVDIPAYGGHLLSLTNSITDAYCP